MSMAPPERGRASGQSALFDFLDSSAGNDVRTLRAVVRVGQAVLGAQRSLTDCVQAVTRRPKSVSANALLYGRERDARKTRETSVNGTGPANIA
jgi:hypothetical protein